MIDPDLERRFIDCKELLEIWHRFHGYFGLAVKGDLKLLTHEREAEFLKLKSRIAMLHDSFMESLRHDAEIGQHILTIIERSITLKHLSKLSLAEVKKMEIEWHESYLLLSETVASLEERRDVLANVNPTKYKIDRFKAGLVLNMKAFFGGILFKILLILIGIPVIIIIINQFWPISNLKKIKATRDFYYSAANFYRKILSPGMPFDRLEDIPRDTTQRPDTLESDKSTYTKESAISIPLFQSSGIRNILSSGNIIFKDETFKIKKTNFKLVILMFMFKEEDGNDKADKCATDFNNWVNSLAPSDKSTVTSNFDVFNKNNVFIVIYSPRESDRKAVKELEFGIR